MMDEKDKGMLIVTLAVVAILWSLLCSSGVAYHVYKVEQEREYQTLSFD